MNAELQSIRDKAPTFVKQQRRRDLVFYVFYAVALIALGGAIYGSIVNWNQGDQITKIEKSACADAEAHPSDRQAVHECQEIRAAAERSANQTVTCLPFHRAGYECPKAGSPLAKEQRAREARGESPSSPIAGGGDAESTGNPGHSPSEPSPGGSSGNGKHLSPPKATEETRHNSGGESSAPSTAAPSPSTAPSSAGGSSTTTEHTETTVEEPAPEPQEPVRSGLGAVTESVGSTVEGLGETVGGTVESVAGTTCSLAKVLCP